MYEVISVGSSLVDIFIHSSLFSVEQAQKGVLLCQRYGEKLEVDGFNLHTGGGGSNTAVGFARHGFRVGIISELGQDIFAQVVIDEFHRERVATNLLIKEKMEHTGGSVILVDDRGGRTAMVNRGASSMLDAKDIAAGPVERADWVHLSTIDGRLAALEKIFRLRSKIKRMSWNPGTRELSLLRQSQISFINWPVEIFVVNREEWLSLGAMATLILRQTPIVIITNGSQIGGIITQKQAYTFQPTKVKSVDDTGAGDAFAVGFVASYMKHQSIDLAVQEALANSTSVIQHFGAKTGLLTRYS